MASYRMSFKYAIGDKVWVLWGGIIRQEEISEIRVDRRGVRYLVRPACELFYDNAIAKTPMALGAKLATMARIRLRV